MLVKASSCPVQPLRHHLPVRRSPQVDLHDRTCFQGVQRLPLRRTSPAAPRTSLGQDYPGVDRWGRRGLRPVMASLNVGSTGRQNRRGQGTDQSGPKAAPVGAASHSQQGPSRTHSPRLAGLGPTGSPRRPRSRPPLADNRDSGKIPSTSQKIKIPRSLPGAWFYPWILAGAGGFEPPTTGFGDQRSTRLSYAPAAEICLVPLEGLEPPTRDLGRRRSIL